jgi:hypothetical protein
MSWCGLGLAQLLVYLPESHFFTLFVYSFPIGQSKDSTQRNAEQIEQESVQSWTHHITRAQNL